MISGPGRLSSRERSTISLRTTIRTRSTIFGSFEIDDQKFIFKHNYYDKSMQYDSDDPGDPQKTTRVLTIMLADEY